MIDGGGKFLRIIMNKASFDQDSPSVFPWPRGSGSRSVLRIGTNPEEFGSGLSQESNDGCRERFKINPSEVAALFHGFNDISGTLKYGDTLFNRPNYSRPVFFLLHLFVHLLK